MKQTHSRASFLSALVVSALLAACGGGGKGSDGATNDVSTGQNLLSNGSGGQTSTGQETKTGTTTPTTPTVPTTPAAPVFVTTKPAPFQCATGALTCFEVASMATVNQPTAIVTLGQPFKVGDLLPTQGLIAKGPDGVAIPMQMDAVATRSGDANKGVAPSVRMGVITAKLTNLAVGEKRVISLFKVTKSMQAAVTPDASGYEFDIEATVYHPQITLLNFGDRNGQTPGTPYLEGESITLTLTGPATETYTVPITAALAGGGWPTLTKIAAAFKAAIDANANTAYKATREGEEGGYENVWLSTREGVSGTFTATVSYSGLAKYKVTKLVDAAPTQTYAVSAGDALRSAVSKGGDGHLRGAVANEYTLSVPFKLKQGTQLGAEHPHLTARLHVRLLDGLSGGGVRSRTDMVIENNWIYRAAPGNLYYSLKVTNNKTAETLFTQSAFKHNHHSRWHKVIWQGGEVLARVRQYMPYVLNSGVLYHYNENLTIPESVLATEDANLKAKATAQAVLGPMANVFLNPAFGTTGARPEIGPYPRWTALYLLSLDDRARASMLANADAAGAVPSHYRDENTLQPVSIDLYPGLALRYGSSEVAFKLPTMADDLTIWTPDASHQGSFAFVPYLVTGDAYYLEEVMFWAAYNLGGMDPSARQRSAGLFHYEQIRGQSWSLRSLSEATRAVPDAHPMKSYFDAKLSSNLTSYNSRYNATSSVASPLGFIDNPFSAGQTMPWQMDFMVIVLSQLAIDGNRDARTLFEFFAAFSVGRFQHESDAGWCLANAPTPAVKTRDANGQLVKTWKDLVTLNWPGVTCSDSMPIEPLAYANTVVGYAAAARGMMSAVYNAGVTSVLPTYLKWVDKTPLETDAAFATDPTWAIVPMAGIQ